jgi:hypothetical protein
MDLHDTIAWEPLVAEEVAKKGYEFCAISAVTGQGVREMLQRIWHLVEAAPDPRQAVVSDELIVIRPEIDENAFTIERLDEQTWRIV